MMAGNLNIEQRKWILKQCSILYTIYCIPTFGPPCSVVLWQEWSISNLFVLNVQSTELNGRKCAKYDGTNKKFTLVDSDCKIYLS